MRIVGWSAVGAILLHGCAQSSATDSSRLLPQAVWETDRMVFTDPRLGYQLDLPPDWIVRAKGGESVTYNEVLTQILSPGCTLDAGATPPNGSCEVIDVVMLADHVSRLEVCEQQVITPQEINSTATEMIGWALDHVNGVPGYWLEFRLDGSSETLAAVAWLGTYVVSFGTHNTPELVGTMRTLRSVDRAVP